MFRENKQRDNRLLQLVLWRLAYGVEEESRRFRLPRTKSDRRCVCMKREWRLQILWGFLGRVIA